MRHSLEKIILFSSAYVYKNLAMIFLYTQEANSPFYTSYVVLRRLVLYSERDLHTNRVWSMSVTDTRMFFLPSPGDIPPWAWQHGLCGCCDDKRLTCMTIICPCIVAGRNAEAVGESCCLNDALALCIFSYINIFSNIVIRGKIRDKFGIDESVVRDCLMSACGLRCAYIQQGQ